MSRHLKWHPTDKQIEDLFQELYDKYSDSDVGDNLIKIAAVREALEQWGTPEPIALEDEGPKPSDLDDKGWCWWWNNVDATWEMYSGSPSTVAYYRTRKQLGSPYPYTHWLPHWAIKQPKSPQGDK